MKNSKKSKFLSSVLSLALVFSCVQVLSASKESNSTKYTSNSPESSSSLITEEGKTIGIRSPIVRGNHSNSLKLQNKENVRKNSIQHSIKLTPAADTVIEVPFEFNNGEFLRIFNRTSSDFTKSEESNNVIAGNIYNKDGNSIGIFSAKLIGVDEEANLHANTTGNILKLHADTTEPIEIVFTAAATYYKDYFSSFAWITRSGVLSLSLTHTNYIYDAPTQYESEVRLFDSWDKLYSIHSTSSNWSNTDGMYDQYFCHVIYAPDKNPWNLEPARQNVGWHSTVLHLCNPPLE